MLSRRSRPVQSTEPKRGSRLKLAVEQVRCDGLLRHDTAQERLLDVLGALAALEPSAIQDVVMDLADAAATVIIERLPRSGAARPLRPPSPHRSTRDVRPGSLQS